MKYVVLDKKIGETPLKALQTWQEAHPAYAHMPAAYAGRLDPMAYGKLLILLGEECKKREKYHGLDKEYEIEVLLDVGSDTGDILGLTTLNKQETRIASNALVPILNAEIGTHMHPYPAFSSKTVGGKPLFLYTLEGTLDTITIPRHEETIYSIHLQHIRSVTSSELESRVMNLLAQAPITNDPSKTLGKNFRIEEVTQTWQNLFGYAKNRRFAVMHLHVICGSGTYMRSLAERIGTSLGTSALALSIHRTTIGRYHQLGPISFWTKKF